MLSRPVNLWQHKPPPQEKVNQDHQTGASAGHAQPNKSRYPRQPWSKGSENCYVAIARTCIVVNALIAHIDISAGT